MTCTENQDRDNFALSCRRPQAGQILGRKWSGPQGPDSPGGVFPHPRSRTPAEAVSQGPLMGSACTPGFLSLLTEQSPALGRCPGETGRNYVALLSDPASQASSVAFT